MQERCRCKRDAKVHANVCSNLFRSHSVLPHRERYFLVASLVHTPPTHIILYAMHETSRSISVHLHAPLEKVDMEEKIG